MRKMKVLLALVLALALTMTLVGSAMAATITIHRDSSWESSSTEDRNATYTWHKVFDATITSAAGVDQSTGALTGSGNVVYTVDSQEKATAVNALTTLKAEAGSDGSWYISKVGTPTDATILAEIKTLVENNPSLFPGTAVTSDANPVEINVTDNGYYYIEASNGKDVIIQTLGDVEINEKNDYPTIDKEQKKAADPTYSEAVVPAEIGTYIDYQVTVHIPADATKAIKVFDTMSDGLDWDETFGTNGLTVTPAISYSALTSADSEYDANADWQIVFSAETVVANRNTDIVITYRALITEAALTDTGRENEVTLTYDNGNYVVTDHVNYTPYFGGIEKVDGADHNTKLENVKFEVTVGGANFPVKLVEVSGGQNYYVPDPTGTSNEVLTGANGLVIIRGLDGTKTYTLTETETNAGYNLLPTPTNLTLEEDTGTAYTTATYSMIENNQGAQLPSTGGIGTTIFYIAGIVLVLGAAAVIIARRKAEQE